MSDQTAIPCLLMRGGTSKGAYFLASDLPEDPAQRDRVLLAAFGSPDARQIDGVGGAHPLTSKVAIVSRSTRPGCDVDYLFAQVVVDEARVDTAPTCGNILAGVAPFALERGLVPAADGETRVRILMVNTDSLCEATVETPGGVVRYGGTARISGVPGTAAPVMLTFADTAGSSCGALFPTGSVVDEIDGVPVTCIDNGMPVVVVDARQLGRTGYESPEALNADAELKARLEAIRLQVGPRMNLGDVRAKVVPKMTLVAPPREDGAISTRTFIPKVCHEAIGVLGAVSVATACVVAGTTAAGMARLRPATRQLVSVEHPTGEFTVELATRADADGVVVERAALLRTARALFDGQVLIPCGVWDGRRAPAAPAAAAAAAPAVS
jgi:4-oxalomesaconate tautomerase